MSQHFNNPKNHYRPSAYELSIEQRLNDTRNMLWQLTGMLKSAFPNTPLPDPNGAFGNGGRVLTYFDQPTDESLLTGHGPRFVAHYNLAESDEARKRLLDTLPAQGNGFQSYSSVYCHIGDLTADYAFRYSDRSDESVAPEFTAWLENARATDQFKPIQGDDLRIVGTMFSERHRFSFDTEWRLVIKPDIQTISYTPPPRQNRDCYGRTGEPTVFDPVELVVVPVTDLKGFVIFSLEKSNSHHGKRVLPRLYRWVVWSEMERQWCMTEGNYFPGSRAGEVCKRFLEYVGMPPLDLPTHVEILSTCQNLHDFATARLEEWSKDLSEYGPFNERTLSLPGVMILKIRGRRSWDSIYDRHDRLTFELLREDLKRDGCAVSFTACSSDHRELVPLVRMVKNSSDREEIKGSLPVPTRQKRTFLEQINLFLEADPSTLVMTETPNEDYRPPKPVESDPIVIGP